MYYLHPPAEWTAFRSTPRPSQKTDANGQPMVERFPAPGQPPRPLLDFQILSDLALLESNISDMDQHCMSQISNLKENVDNVYANVISSANLPAASRQNNVHPSVNALKLRQHTLGTANLI